MTVTQEHTIEHQPASYVLNKTFKLHMDVLELLKAGRMLELALLTLLIVHTEGRLTIPAGNAPMVAIVIE